MIPREIRPFRVVVLASILSACGGSDEVGKTSSSGGDASIDGGTATAGGRAGAEGAGGRPAEPPAGGRRGDGGTPGAAGGTSTAGGRDAGPAGGPDAPAPDAFRPDVVGPFDARVDRSAARESGTNTRQPDASLEEGGSGADAGFDANMEAARDAPAPIDVKVLHDGNAADATGGLVDARTRDAATADGAADAPDSCDAPNVTGLALEPTITGVGLATLSFAVQPPNSNDWYLVEQRGRIMIYSQGSLRPTPFLDVRNEFSINPIYDERGIGSLAFAPDYAQSGRVYLVMTPSAGPQINRDLLLEFTRSAADPYVLDETSRRALFDLPNSSSFLGNIHNSYTVRFGPDGMLYVGMGDGGGTSCNNIEPDAPQDVGSPFGKILRLDPSAPAPHGAAGNPFVATGDARVWHYGVRNPFRFTFDRLTGDLYLGDVGQNSYEEISFAPAGASGSNFGWAAYEGDTITCPNRALRSGSTHTEPIFVADRRASSTQPWSDYQAIVGGVVYRGQALPELDGVYLFGDYQGRRMGALRQCDDRTSPVTILRKRCDPNFPSEACLAASTGVPAFDELRGIVEDHAGEIYVVANGSSLLKVVPAP